MASLTVGDLIPQLANLPFYAPNPRALQLGGQNFTHCCLRAVNESLTISSNNSLAFTNSSFFLPGTTPASLKAAADNDQFPCGAEWNGDSEGAPVVQVPYTWCTSQCPGWEISHVSKLSQWIGPLVQFILPSLAFCLNVPRARKLAVPDVVFRARPHDVLGFATYWLRLLGAMLLMTLDTTVWLSICFAFAGPMLMSAMCEFVLDRKVLEFLRPPAGSGLGRRGKPLIPAKVRAQLLLAVVVGNVRISTTGFVERRRASYATAVSVVSETEAICDDNNNDNGGMGNAMKDAEAAGPPQQQQLVDDTWDRVMVMIDEYEELQEKGGLRVGVVSLPTKLKALLNSQASTIGAPVLFFVGGFIYTVIDIQNSLGDNDSAHALAFGMWWMTIPYLATVSCAMLASNSSSVLQGIVYDGGGGSHAGPTRPAPGFWGDIKTRLKKHPFVRRMLDGLNGYELVEHTYEGRFQTVTLWNRGLNKRRWVHEAIKDYAKEHAATTGASHPREEGAVSNESELPPPPSSSPSPSTNVITPDELRLGLRLRFRDLWNVFWGTAFLLLVLSCRTITYLLYASSQTCAVGLWAWEARLKVRYGARWSETPSREKVVNWWSQALVGFVGVFAAVGGTLMQLLGPYRACGCRIAASQWLRPSDPGALVVLSTNTADSIRAAQEWWTGTGTASVILLGVVCALAWWHQRRLRKLFREEAESLETDWVPTITLVGMTAPTAAGATAEQPDCSPTEMTSPKKELG
ncbi:hypothetical protein PG984_002394 [Apiospora sp. TS-2023a]